MRWSAPWYVSGFCSKSREKLLRCEIVLLLCFFPVSEGFRSVFGVPPYIKTGQKMHFFWGTIDKVIGEVGNMGRHVWESCSYECELHFCFWKCVDWIDLWGDRVVRIFGFIVGTYRAKRVGRVKKFFVFLGYSNRVEATYFWNYVNRIYLTWYPGSWSGRPP